MCAFSSRTPVRLLIIDDDIDLLMLLERCLIKEGYAVETAASLPEAEEIIPHFTPQLILLDINVKGDDGRQLCWKIKHSKQKIKVILMSGFDYSLSRAVLFGADDLIPKPMETAVLLQKLDFHFPSVIKSAHR